MNDEPRCHQCERIADGQLNMGLCFCCEQELDWHWDFSLDH